jgi:hypothetical protein
LKGTIYLITYPNIGKVDLLSLLSSLSGACVSLWFGSGAVVGRGGGGGGGRGGGGEGVGGVHMHRLLSLLASTRLQIMESLGVKFQSCTQQKKCQLFIYYDLKHLTTMMFEKHRTTDNSKTVVHY